jgi:hypothetical protein
MHIPRTVVLVKVSYLFRYFRTGLVQLTDNNVVTV